MTNPNAVRPGGGSGANHSLAQVIASRFTLPSDLVKQARRRLGLLALTIGCMCVVFGPIVLLGVPFDEEGTGGTAWALRTLCVALASFSVYFATRTSWLSDAKVLSLGLAYQILLSLSENTFDVWETYRLTGMPPQMTSSAVFILVFPLLVPCRPWLTLVTSLIVASTSPLGLGIGYWAGVIDQPTLAQYIQVSISPLGCVVLAYLGSRIIYNIGAELVRARELGSYTLVEMLGRGGMGEVWKARHRTLSRPAAIKLIKPEVLDEDQDAAHSLIKRFELEAQTTASLRSAHTVELYDFGTSTDGTFYYVMELLDGLDLQALVEKHGALPAHRVVFLLRQICHSLHEAHQIGLIHRDIKPANIFVGRYGAEVDFIKVLDFGLVKQTQSTLSELEQDLTQQGGIVGTPAFIAPEMVLSEMEIDSRVDIYALGCVAYWLLTGSHVFDSKSPMEAAIHHVKDQPEAPSSRSELDVPATLDSIVLSCLEKDPQKRPQSVKELSESLREVELDPQWTEFEALRWWDRSYPVARA